MSARHQVILAQIKQISDIGGDLQINLTLTETGVFIKKQADDVVEALNRGLNDLNTATPGMTWDGLMVGSLRFFLGVMDEAENQLQSTMILADIPLEGEETVH